MEESNPMILCASGLDDEKVVVGAQAAMEEQDVFQCNICMDPPTNSVLTKCGHLFCWSCLHQWLRNGKKKPCPVCKLKVGSGDITPIYGCQRGSSSKSSDALIPPRPSAPSKRGRATPSGGSVDATNVSMASHSTTAPSTQASGIQWVALMDMPAFWHLTGVAWNGDNQARVVASTPTGAPYSLEVGSTSIASHQEPLRESEPEVEEMDATEYNRALQERRAMGRPSRPRSCRRRPY